MLFSPASRLIQVVRAHHGSPGALAATRFEMIDPSSETRSSVQRPFFLKETWYAGVPSTVPRSMRVRLAEPVWRFNVSWTAKGNSLNVIALG